MTELEYLFKRNPNTFVGSKNKITFLYDNLSTEKTINNNLTENDFENYQNIAVLVCLSDENIDTIINFTQKKNNNVFLLVSYENLNDFNAEKINILFDNSEFI